MARAMTAWSRDIVLCTHGSGGLSKAQRQALVANGIAIESARIESLGGSEGKLEAIRFEGGREILRRGIFFDMPCHPQSELALSLGCELTSSGAIRCGKYEASSVPGVFVAGNILKDVQLSIVAAAEGARAAFGINRALTREAFKGRAGEPGVIDHPGPDSA
jgi:thioredoxin reductase